MRTTITIPEELIHKTMKVSGKKYMSEAITFSLQDYLDLRERLGFMEKLYDRKLPHSFKTVKKQRRKGTWSF